MTTTNRLFSLFAALLTTAIMMADVVYEPLEVASGFNRDVIAESYPISTSNVISYLRASGTYYCMATASVIDSVNTHLGFNQADIDISRESGWPDDNGNPNDRIIRVVAEASADPLYKDVFWKLAPYDQPNVLTIRPNHAIGGSGTLKFKKVGCYNKVFFLLASAFEGTRPNTRTVSTTIHYTDGSTANSIFEFAGLGGQDANKKDGHKVRMINIYEGSSGFKKNTSRDSGKAYAAVFDMDVDFTKLIDRIEFSHDKDCTAVMIFGVTGRTADVEIPEEESLEVADVQNHQFTISWDEVGTAEKYSVDVATDEYFQHMVEGYNNQIVTKNDTIVSGLDEDEDYYWRVRAVNADGTQSASSATRRVRTAGNNPPETSETSENIEEMLQGYAGYRAVVPSIKIHRSLCRNGYFNTLCLPFSMNAEQIAASPLVGARVFEYVQATKTNAGLDIVINGPIDHIDAGVPYLVNWEPTTPEWIGNGEDGLIFENVNITTYKGDTIGADDQVQFIGNIGIANLVELNQNNLFLGANNTLYYPEGDNRLRGFRAYFNIPTDGPNAAPGAPARLVMRPQIPTDVESVEVADARNHKILQNGQLIIIHNGVIYNAQGQVVRSK